MLRIQRSISLVAMMLAWMVVMAPYALSKDVTYRGKAIDADTKEPIEGAVVVVYWHKAWQTISGEGTKLKEVKEILTDKNGEWSVVGPKGQEHDPHPYLSFFLLLSYTREPQFIIFKPGYCSWPKGFFIEACKERIKPKEGDEFVKGGVLDLPPLTKHEERTRVIPSPEGGENALGKQKELIRLINQERNNLGLPEAYK